MGLVGMSLGAFYSGRPVVLMPPEMFVKRPVEWLRVISRYRASVSYAPNFAYDLCVRRVKDRDLDGLDLSSWRVAGCGAEPINAHTLEAFAGKFSRAGFRVSSFLPSYGLAEHVLAATFGVRQREPRVDVVSSDALSARRVAAGIDPADDSAIRLVSCGRPLPGHAVRIVADDGAEARERQVGEIVLAGPSVMLGYCKDPESTSRGDPRWMAAHRRSRLPLGRGAVRLRAAEGSDRDERPQISPAGSRMECRAAAGRQAGPRRRVWRRRAESRGHRR